MSGLRDFAAAALLNLDPETAHRLTIRALAMGLGGADNTPDDPVLATEIGGLAIPNAVGIAPGFDKSAEAVDALGRAGFGFVEVGTITPLPQAGNPKPRLFRLPEDQAVINRMGFNNDGLSAAAQRLERARRVRPVGANIGANKESADRIGDYVTGLMLLWGLCDYFTINISSPNTPGLRALQTKAALEELLGRVRETRESLPSRGAHVPVFLKVAPDLEDGEVETIAAVTAAFGLDGIIVSNTTVSRPDSLVSASRSETGGLSGAPLLTLSTQVLWRFHEANAAGLTLIGVGGIASGADAYAKVRAGANAVQVYSALVYGGPSLVGRIKRDLAARLRADGFSSIAEAVGVA